jgi:hypothetical protein
MGFNSAFKGLMPIWPVAIHEQKPFQKFIILSLIIADIVLHSCQYGVCCVSNILFYTLDTLNFGNKRAVDSNLCL